MTEEGKIYNRTGHSVENAFLVLTEISGKTPIKARLLDIRTRFDSTSQYELSYK